jgi:hypothetical protein
VKRIHGMIADLEKEGYDAREIGKEQFNGRAKDNVADMGGMRPFPQSARCWETFCRESVCTVTCCAARREGERQRERGLIKEFSFLCKMMGNLRQIKILHGRDGRFSQNLHQKNIINVFILTTYKNIIIIDFFKIIYIVKTLS